MGMWCIFIVFLFVAFFSENPGNDIIQYLITASEIILDHIEFAKRNVIIVYILGFSTLVIIVTSILNHERKKKGQNNEKGQQKDIKKSEDSSLPDEFNNVAEENPSVQVLWDFKTAARSSNLKEKSCNESPESSDSEDSLWPRWAKYLSTVPTRSIDEYQDARVGRIYQNREQHRVTTMKQTANCLLLSHVPQNNGGNPIHPSTSYPEIQEIDFKKLFRSVPPTTIAQGKAGSTKERIQSTSKDNHDTKTIKATSPCKRAANAKEVMANLQQNLEPGRKNINEKCPAVRSSTLKSSSEKKNMLNCSQKTSKKIITLTDNENRNSKKVNRSKQHIITPNTSLVKEKYSEHVYSKGNGPNDLVNSVSIYTSATSQNHWPITKDSTVPDDKVTYAEFVTLTGDPGNKTGTKIQSEVKNTQIKPTTTTSSIKAKKFPCPIHSYEYTYVFKDDNNWVTTEKSTSDSYPKEIVRLTIGKIDQCSDKITDKNEGDEINYVLRLDNLKDVKKDITPDKNKQCVRPSSSSPEKSTKQNNISEEHVPIFQTSKVSTIDDKELGKLSGKNNSYQDNSTISPQLKSKFLSKVGIDVSLSPDTELHIEENLNTTIKNAQHLPSNEVVHIPVKEISRQSTEVSTTSSKGSVNLFEIKQIPFNEAPQRTPSTKLSSNETQVYNEKKNSEVNYKILSTEHSFIASETISTEGEKYWKKSTEETKLSLTELQMNLTRIDEWGKSGFIPSTKPCIDWLSSPSAKSSSNTDIDKQVVLDTKTKMVGMERRVEMLESKLKYGELRDRCVMSRLIEMEDKLQRLPETDKMQHLPEIENRLLRITQKLQSLESSVASMTRTMTICPVNMPNPRTGSSFGDLQVEKYPSTPALPPEVQVPKCSRVPRPYTPYDFKDLIQEIREEMEGKRIPSTDSIGPIVRPVPPPIYFHSIYSNVYTHDIYESTPP